MVMRWLRLLGVGRQVAKVESSVSKEEPKSRRGRARSAPTKKRVT